MGTIVAGIEWEQRDCVKKGNIGEKLVQEFLESKGFICYQSVTPKAHAFDFLAVRNKREMIICEVKTKSLMNKYNATGFNYRNFKEYKAIGEKYSIPIFVFFVDEHFKEIYGNWLHVINKPHPYKTGTREDVYPLKLECRNGSTVVLYHRDSLRNIAPISDEAADQLTKYTNRNYEYRPQKEVSA